MDSMKLFTAKEKCLSDQTVNSVYPTCKLNSPALRGLCDLVGLYVSQSVCLSVFQQDNSDGYCEKILY